MVLCTKSVIDIHKTLCFQTRTIANQMAEKLNAKLGYTAKVEEEEEVVETVTRYEEELEINDFPQTCRWRVTSRVSGGPVGSGRGAMDRVWIFQSRDSVFDLRRFTVVSGRPSDLKCSCTTIRIPISIQETKSPA